MSSVELRGLKGLQGLDLDGLLHDSKKPTSTHNISNLSVEMLTTGKYQPRTVISDDSLFDLASSIKAQGIIQPLIVRNIGADRYEIIAGERRWRAAKIAGLSDVPAIIRNVTDETALAFALIENIQRESLNPIDEAVSLVRLKDEFSMTHEEIAERVGRSRSAVTNLMRLLSLHHDVQGWLRTNEIEMGHARALLSLDAQLQLKVAQRVIEKGMSVRETEKMVQSIIKLPHHIQESIPSKFDAKINDWTKQLSKKLSSNVKIHLNAKGEGKITISVQSPEEIEWLIKSINCD
ncbi:MAG: ParB/RepB/Spo0J family partition protein [Gammaproteobacteria bacterium]|nr:ParB/RepB/Spo0J family partition protein [Gammaproteobacteria bacterium]MCW5584145.1 ParB/RepB/Spo0J family partition protein [Gammaproteobacteria bacterium]